ncbi:zinc finger and BTB domain-containing protein 17-like isoform X2 [Homarus americanus]|uniref:zinc finger and BTB domain-containing protein 17-like isoform X2 n=1 Tax=Homarus americanus TaxID=6706 RepID=UPI001C4408BE|nr:zinc finger and BTB domain-containing protein 17-like isoform X2 [Homarus americanus]XP_042206863.1 zinc finger and BTB domain-containing protein 17-like isoform X2 [Homarus americanus]XP_042206865.1 zinc finger and BTB domain-containing protein 17-like isoform X2 [Homarus americanus]
MDNESMSGSTSIPPDTVNLSTNTGVGGGVREMGSVGMSGSTRRTSRVWRYFGMVDNCHYICRLCSFVGAYTNTTNMRKHIQHHHPERFQDILDHTRPSTRPFYVGSIPRMRPPQHFTQQQTSPYPGGLVYPHTLPGKRMILPKPTEMSYVHGDTSMPSIITSQQCSHMTSQPSLSESSAGTSYPTMTSHIPVTSHAASSGQLNTVTVCELSPEETKLVSQFLPTLSEATDCSSDSETTSRGLAAPEDHGSSDFSHNNGDEVPVAVSPELFLAESNERESTPAPPTPTPQKPESYQLRHNNHLTIVLEALARDESFMDVTLTAQGRSLKAHKSVLSAVSPYFRGVLRDNPCQHPIIIMPRDVRFEELFSIVNYIYKGEMTVAAEDLTSLLKTAEILQVSGLAPSDSSATVNPHTESSTAGNARSSSASSSSSSSNLPSVSKTSRMVKTSTQQTTTPPARPKSRDSMINPTDFMDVDMTCVKEEVQSADEEESEEQVTKESSSQPPGGGMKGDQTLQHSLTTFSPSFDPDLEQPTASTSSSQDISPTTLPIKSDPETEINPLGTVGTEDPHPFMCPHCQEHHRDMDTMITHLRVRHPTKPSFTCGCGRVYTRQMLHQAHARMCSSLS